MRAENAALQQALSELALLRGDLFGIVAGSGEASQAVRDQCRRAMNRAEKARGALNPAYYSRL